MAGLYRRGVNYVIRGWNEVPEVVVSLSAMAFGTAMAIKHYRRETQLGLAGHMYKHQYTVMRKNDVADPSHPGYN